MWYIILFTNVLRRNLVIVYLVGFFNLPRMLCIIRRHSVGKRH